MEPILSFLDLIAVLQRTTQGTNHPAAVRRLPSNQQALANEMADQNAPTAPQEEGGIAFFRRPLMPPVILTRPFTPGEKDDIFAPIQLVPFQRMDAARFLAGPSDSNSEADSPPANQVLLAGEAPPQPGQIPAGFASTEARPLLPDLVPNPEASLDAETVTDPKTGRRLLNFSAAVANVGDGPLEADLVGDPYDTRYHNGGFDFDLPAFQVIQHEDGAKTRVPAGTFFFREGGGQEIYNMLDLVHFRLRAIDAQGQPAETVGENRDGFFYLADVVPFAPQRPAAARTPVYQGVDYHDLPGQGISVGYATHFPGQRGLVGKFVPGHTIDVTDLPPGRYVLEVVVDPANRFIEKDENNNVGRVLVTI